MDSMGSRRSQMFAVIDRAMERRSAASAKNERPARTFWRLLAAAGYPEEFLPGLEEWPEHEILAAEFATVGFYISGHPLSKYVSKLTELGAMTWPIEGRGTARRLPSLGSWSRCAACVRARGNAGES